MLKLSVSTYLDCIIERKLKENYVNITKKKFFMKLLSIPRCSWKKLYFLTPIVSHYGRDSEKSIKYIGFENAY